MQDIYIHFSPYGTRKWRVGIGATEYGDGLASHSSSDFAASRHRRAASPCLRRAQACTTANGTLNSHNHCVDTVPGSDCAGATRAIRDIVSNGRTATNCLDSTGNSHGDDTGCYTQGPLSTTNGLHYYGDLTCIMTKIPILAAMGFIRAANDIRRVTEDGTEFLCFTATVYVLTATTLATSPAGSRSTSLTGTRARASTHHGALVRRPAPAPASLWALVRHHRHQCDCCSYRLGDDIGSVASPAAPVKQHHHHSAQRLQLHTSSRFTSHNTSGHIGRNTSGQRVFGD
jgi:hypothetical protein